MNNYIEDNKALMKLEDKFRNKNHSANNQLYNVLEQAKNILQENSHIEYEKQHPIFSYIKIFTDLIQSKLAVSILMNGRDNVYAKKYGYFNTVNAYMYPIDKIILKDKVSKGRLYINLEMLVSNARDPIFTHLWNATRLSDAIKNIGSGFIVKGFSNTRENNFEYDNLNHKGEYIYPLGIINVYNGNHSISAGLNKSEGNIIITDLVDVSYLYDMYEFDGKYLVNKETKEKERIYFEFGALFEIGRLLLKNKAVFPEVVQETLDAKKSYKYT